MNWLLKSVVTASVFGLLFILLGAMQTSNACHREPLHPSQMVYHDEPMGFGPAQVNLYEWVCHGRSYSVVLKNGDLGVTCLDNEKDI